MSKVILVDDHQIFREGLKLLLNKIPNLEIIDEASNGKVLIQKIEQGLTPDLILMDINMPQINGIEASKAVLKLNPNLKILILTTNEDAKDFGELLNLGVAGYLLKSASFDEFKEGISKILNGDNYYNNNILIEFTKSLSQKQKLKNNLPKLTSRETEVLELICKGYSNKKIADSLFISVKAIEKHKSSLLLKTNTQNTLNLVLYTFNNKILKISS